MVKRFSILAGHRNESMSPGIQRFMVEGSANLVNRLNMRQLLGDIIGGLLHLLKLPQPPSPRFVRFMKTVGMAICPRSFRALERTHQCRGHVCRSAVRCRTWRSVRRGPPIFWLVSVPMWYSRLGKIMFPGPKLSETDRRLAELGRKPRCLGCAAVEGMFAYLGLRISSVSASFNILFQGAGNLISYQLISQGSSTFSWSLPCS